MDGNLSYTGINKEDSRVVLISEEPDNNKAIVNECKGPFKKGKKVKRKSSMQN